MIYTVPELSVTIHLNNSVCFSQHNENTYEIFRTELSASTGLLYPTLVISFIYLQLKYSRVRCPSCKNFYLFCLLNNTKIKITYEIMSQVKHSAAATAAKVNSDWTMLTRGHPQ